MLKIRRNALKSCDLKQNSQKSGFFIKPVSIIGHIIQYTHNCRPYLAIFCYLKIYLKIKISTWNSNSIDTLIELKVMIRSVYNFAKITEEGEWGQTGQISIFWPTFRKIYEQILIKKRGAAYNNFIYK